MMELAKYLKDLHPLLDIHGKWMFLPNARTASKIMGAYRLKHLAYHRGAKNWEYFFDWMFKDKIEEIFKFTFVRNPWDRVLSAFMFLQQRRDAIGATVEFNNFIKNVFSKTGPSFNLHYFNKQSRNFLFDGKLFGVFIGRFENLKRDWKFVAEKIGINTRIPKYNSSEHQHYSRYYDNESIKIVGEIYREEIDFLGYEFEHDGLVNHNTGKK